MNETMTWTVVHFETDDTVEAVPTTWINGDLCLWPPLTKEKLQKAIQNGEMNTHWPSHKVSIFRDSTFRDYLTARAKARKAEMFSDLNSDIEGNQKRKKKKKILSSSDSDADDTFLPRYQKKLPTPPKKKIRLSLQNSDVATSSTMSSIENENMLKEIINNNQASQNNSGQGSGSLAGTSTCNNSCRNCCTKNKEYKQDKKTLFVIKNICCDILSKVDNLLNNAPKPDVCSSVPENLLNQVGVEYPMSSIQELATFDEFFKNDENYIALVRLFSKFGGSTTGDFVRRCLAPLISNQLSMKYSFIGRKGKENFSIMCLSKAIVDAADKISFIKNKKETESAIGSWLKRGKARQEAEKK